MCVFLDVLNFCVLLVDPRESCMLDNEPRLSCMPSVPSLNYRPVCSTAMGF